MAGTMVISLFPTGGALNAAVLNIAPVSLLTESNKHVGGTAYRHGQGEIDTGTLDETVTPNAPNTGAATADVVAIRHQTAMAKIMGGTGNYATRYSALPVGADLTSLFAFAGAYNVSTNVLGRTSNANPSTTMSRDSVAGTTLGSVSLGGSGNSTTSGIATVYAAGTLAQTQDVFNFQQGNGRNIAKGGISTAVEVSNATDHAGMTVYGPVTTSGTGAGFVGNASTATLATTATAVAFGGITGGTSGDVNKLLAINGSGAVILKAFDSSLIGNRTIKLLAISDLAASADGTTRIVTVAAGTFLALNAVPALVQRTFNGGTVTVPSPAGGAQYTCIYLDNTATLQQNNGTVGGAQDTAPLPSGGYAVAWAYMPNGGTALYSTQADWVAAGSPSAKGYLIPQNVNGGAVGSGGGGSSGAPIISPFGIWGSNAGLGLSANAQAIDQVLDGTIAAGGALTVNATNPMRLDRVRANAKIIAPSYLRAAADNFFAGAVTGNIDGALTTTGGQATMRVPVGQPPIFIVFSATNWQICDNTSISSNTVAAAGAYTLVADGSGAGDHFTIQLVTSIGANQVPLRDMYFDGTNLFNVDPHGPFDRTKPVINGLSYRTIGGDTGVFNTGLLPNTSLSGTIIQAIGSTITFDLPIGGLVARYRLSGNLQTPASGGTDMRLYGMSSQGAGAALAVISTGGFAQWNGFAGGAIIPGSAVGKVSNLGPGPVNFSIGYYNGSAIAASPAGFATFLGVFMEVDIRRS